MKENIKITIMAFIVLGLGINAYILYNNNDSSSKKDNKLIGANSTNDYSSNSKAENKVVEKPKHPVTSMAFNENKHDFGSIKQNTTNLHIFEFRNSGSNPLIIESAKGSCGCTVPEYPKEPIMPGDWGEIKVEYKPAKQKGPQTKTVTITANTESPTTQLQILANVIETKE